MQIFAKRVGGRGGLRGHVVALGGEKNLGLSCLLSVQPGLITDTNFAGRCMVVLTQLRRP